MSYKRSLQKKTDIWSGLMENNDFSECWIPETTVIAQISPNPGDTDQGGGQSWPVWPPDAQSVVTEVPCVHACPGSGWGRVWWISEVRHKLQGGRRLEMSRQRDVWQADSLKSSNLDLIPEHSSSSRGVGERQTVKTGQEADPHYVWLHRTKIRSVCRPPSKSRGGGYGHAGV